MKSDKQAMADMVKGLNAVASIVARLLDESEEVWKRRLIGKLAEKIGAAKS